MNAEQKKNMIIRIIKKRKSDRFFAILRSVILVSILICFIVFRFSKVYDDIFYNPHLQVIGLMISIPLLYSVIIIIYIHINEIKNYNLKIQDLTNSIK